MASKSANIIDPIIVIGPPRSGTSNVARILHEHMGIFMGWRFWNPDFAGPQGTYEDLRLMQMNELLDMGIIDIEPWKRRFRRFVHSRQRMQRPWGFKDPRLVPLIGLVKTYFKHPVFIRCKRDKNMVVRSQVRKLDWSREKASSYYDFAEKVLDDHLSDRKYLLIHYPEEIKHKDSSIIDQLSQVEWNYAIS